MADDKSKRDFRDRALQLMKTKRSSISRTRRVSPQQVTELIAKHGNKRETLEREAKALRGRGPDAMAGAQAR